MVGQTSWIGRVAEIAERQKLVVTPGIQILVVVEVINTAIIEEMETGMGATEVEAEIIVTIGGGGRGGGYGERNAPRQRRW